MGSVIFQMKDEHVQRGERKSVCSCPVALLLIESTGLNGWIVTEQKIENRFLDGNGYDEETGARFFECKTPEAVCQFVYGFDNGFDIRPIQFELPIPVRQLQAQLDLNSGFDS